MTDTTELETGLFTVLSEEDRTVRGLLLPYGEESRLSVSKTRPIKFAQGTVAIPRDPSAVTLHDEHSQFGPLARATALEDTEAGIVATFRIFDTDEGDAYLAAPEKRRLSAELADIVRKGVEGVKARLTGAGLVDQGAFASAALFALGEVEEAEETPEEQPAPENQPEEQPAPEAPSADASADKEEAMPNAQAPSTAADEATLDKAKELGANAVFAAMTAVLHGNGQDRAEAETMLAALSDIKISGTGALPATGVLQPAWVGQVWQGRAYQRKYITLGSQGPIQAMEAKGFKIDQGTALVTEWAGNKSAIGSGTATTSVVTSVLTRFAYAADIAREFFDLPGGEGVIAAFWRGVVESYARVSDAKALSQIVAAAGAPVAPSSAIPADYPSALGMLIQGIEAIEDANDSPTFAIMNRAAWQQVLFTPHEKVPEFVNFDFGTKQEGTADGFRVVRGDLGIANTPAVLVGSKNGIRFNELGTTPVQFDALDVAKGGVDRGTVGYLQTLSERPESFVLVGTADAAG
ncbi:hypothetical protein LG314_07945 [Agrococcus terreus]|uniref:hypothetical protein n=1 Tax=Agrococcus terreus TaxID=574649 RepID=UPI0038504D4C